LPDFFISASARWLPKKVPSKCTPNVLRQLLQMISI
jgi:hypothetical protein